MEAFFFTADVDARNRPWMATSDLARIHFVSSRLQSFNGDPCLQRLCERGVVELGIAMVDGEA
jgi:hypothetical protein